MLSSRFLVVSCLYIFYAAGLVTAYPRNQPGDDKQLCQSAQTVTVTIAPRQSPPPANEGQPPIVKAQPGKVNLGNGDKNPKNGSSNPKNDQTNTKDVNAKPSSTGGTPPAKTGTGDPATSLTLDPSVIQKINGTRNEGEANSLTSTNNFIGFCKGKKLTNGKQVQEGSCNPTPMGDIPATDKMPSAKFNSPKNFDTIAANTQFTISLQIQNMVTGTFTNAANTYYAAPQQLVNGVIQGHSHVTVQKITSLGSPEPLNPKAFEFFKGLNGVAKNGVLTADVTNGLKPGVYRIACINSAGNHQEVLGPVAQRGSFNDAIYITVTDGGKNDGKGGDVSASSASPESTSPPSKGGKGGDTSTSSASPESTPPPSKDGKGGDVSTSSAPPQSTSPPSKDGKGGDVSTSASPESTTPPSKDGKGGKNGGKGGDVSTSSASPESTSPPSKDGKEGKKGDKGGDVSTPSASPKSTSTPSGYGQPDTKSSDSKNPAVSPAVSTPDSTPTKGANGKGGKQPQDGGYQYPKRMHKRSRSA